MPTDARDGPCDPLVETIRRRTAELLRRAAPLCKARRARVPDPMLRFDLRGLAAGQAIWRRTDRPLLRFNLDIARRHSADFVERTVAHEVAHLITAACHGRTRPHGPEWQAVMGYLGIDAPSRCHDYALDESQVRRQRRWAYACDCSTHELSTTRHKRIQTRGARYHCRCCGGALRRTEAHGTGAQRQAGRAANPAGGLAPVARAHDDPG